MKAFILIFFKKKKKKKNIVLFMGACSEPGKLVMVTQYLRGGSLLQIIENKAVEITLLHALSMARDT